MATNRVAWDAYTLAVELNKDVDKELSQVEKEHRRMINELVGLCNEVKQLSRVEEKYNQLATEIPYLKDEVHRLREIEDKYNQLSNDVAVLKTKTRRIEQVDGKYKSLANQFEFLKTEINRLEKVGNDTEGPVSQVADIEAKIQNTATALVSGDQNRRAIYENSRLCRPEQPVHPVCVLRTLKNGGLTWTSHPKMPKTVEDVYWLGKCAQGQSSQWFTTEKRATARLHSLDTLEELLQFYGVVDFSDKKSEGEDIKSTIDVSRIDEYMEGLLNVWGMDWQKIVRIGGKKTPTWFTSYWMYGSGILAMIPP